MTTSEGMGHPGVAEASREISGVWGMGPGSLPGNPARSQEGSRAAERQFVNPLGEAIAAAEGARGGGVKPAPVTRKAQFV